jgi:hypothetical protein
VTAGSKSTSWIGPAAGSAAWSGLRDTPCEQRSARVCRSRHVGTLLVFVTEAAEMLAQPDSARPDRLEDVLRAAGRDHDQPKHRAVARVPGRVGVPRGMKMKPPAPTRTSRSSRRNVASPPTM